MLQFVELLLENGIVGKLPECQGNSKPYYNLMSRHLTVYYALFTGNSWLCPEVR